MGVSQDSLSFSSHDSDGSKDFYNLVITIFEASHLYKLIDTKIVENGKYWFSYKLFGILIQTDVFTSLGKELFIALLY